MQYNPQYLENLNILSEDEKYLLEKLNNKISLKEILSNKRFVEKIEIDFIHTSAKIEGNEYSISETMRLLESKKPISSKSIDDANMILNLKDAWDYMLNNDLKITKQSIREIHTLLSQRLLPINQQGCVRTIDVAIAGSNYKPLNNPLELEMQMDKLLDVYDSIQNPYDRAIYIHNNLAYLQYFSDCNKRTARIMQNLSLKNSNKMLMILNTENEEETTIAYKDALLEYYKNGSHRLSANLFIKEMKRNATIFGKQEQQY